MGSSGYNIVTGRNSVDMGRLVPEHAQEAYNRKINDLYSKFRLNPWEIADDNAIDLWMR